MELLVDEFPLFVVELVDGAVAADDDLLDFVLPEVVSPVFELLESVPLVVVLFDELVPVESDAALLRFELVDELVLVSVSLPVFVLSSVVDDVLSVDVSSAVDEVSSSVVVSDEVSLLAVSSVVVLSVSSVVFDLDALAVSAVFVLEEEPELTRLWTETAPPEISAAAVAILMARLTPLCRLLTAETTVLKPETIPIALFFFFG